MKIRLSNLQKIIKEEVCRALLVEAGDHSADDDKDPEHWAALAADPQNFQARWAPIVRLGAGDIPIAQLLDLPAWFDAGADRSNKRLDGAWTRLIATPVTLDYVEKLKAAIEG